MAERYDWPSPQWFEHILSLSQQSSGAPRPELTYRAQYIITGSPCGEVCIFEEMREGRMVAMFRGKRADADVTVTLDYGDYLKIWTELRSSHELPSYRIEGDVAVMAGSIAQRKRRAIQVLQTLHLQHHPLALTQAPAMRHSPAAFD